MKTTYTIMAILATVLFSQTAAAKLGVIRSTIQLENKIEVNVEAEIRNNINNMLAKVQAPTIKTDVAKQIDFITVQLQTNELVHNVSENLPEFKFKVVLAD
jgi:Na+-transporting NADH:ubiquinone oxidoreductase subunit NqrC